jgi:predicted nucleotide-binding protein (sugar kinase/HSP70/actin superfamily)
MELGGTRMLGLLSMMEEDGIETTSLDFHNYLKFICQDKLLDFHRFNTKKCLIK